MYHIPVLLNESIDGLNIHPGGIYVDVTFGGGGHSREILRRLTSPIPSKGGVTCSTGGVTCSKPQALGGTPYLTKEEISLGHLFSFDQDADAEKNITIMGDGEGRIEDFSNFTFVRSNFRYLKNWMRYYGIDHIDGLLADLGVSSHHLDDETRGFSFRFEGPLDMRMNKRGGKTAADIVNEYDEQALADVFYLYGELKNSRRIASAIVKARASNKIKTTQEFLDVVEPLFPREREKKDLAKLFQALRIEVNHEMDALKEMLAAATDLLGEGGRLSVITYHSLEDRIVKNVIKTGNPEGKRITDFYGRVDTKYKAINNKVIVASDEEVERNPRSRSAKLRVAEKAPSQPHRGE